jgi:hypothetical protein
MARVGQRPHSGVRVFISYSRKDQPFAKRLASGLEERGFRSDWDQAASDPDNISTGIAAEDEWWARLQDMIAAADVMVFVVSPDSATSQVCDEEIAYARALEKRIIPVLYRAIDFGKAPPRLAALNVKISFVGNDAYENALDDLTTALARDVNWIRESTRITQEAERWRASERDAGLLLQGSDLRAAEKWVARRPASAPPTSGLVLEFIEASQGAEAERTEINQVQRIRLQELDRVARPFLEAELRSLERRTSSIGPFNRDEHDHDKELLRSLLGIQTRWHPQSARHHKTLGARDGYAEIFQFPCCDTFVRDFLATSVEDPPSQFRADGCKEIPKSIQYESAKQTNPFRSVLIYEHETGRPKRKWRGFRGAFRKAELIPDGWERSEPEVPAPSGRLLSRSEGDAE